MGLLSFRKKNKKCTVPKEPTLLSDNDIESEVSVPAINSVISVTTSRSKNRLDMIFNDTPLPSTSTGSFSGSETSSTRNIRHSLNLKSNHSSNSSINKNISNNAHVDSNHNSAFSQIAPSTNIPPMIKGRRADVQTWNFNSSSDDSDLSSIDSLSSTEQDFVTLEPVSWSDSGLTPVASNYKQEDSTPLIELISRCYTASHGTADSIKNTSVNTSSGRPPSIQRSPGFAIDRMKERHRQDYRKSMQNTPVDNQPFFVRRNNVPGFNQQLNSTQQRHSLMSIHQQTYGLKQNNGMQLNNQQGIKKSSSTHTNNQYNRSCSSSVLMNSIQEKFAGAEPPKSKPNQIIKPLSYAHHLEKCVKINPQPNNLNSTTTQETKEIKSSGIIPKLIKMTPNIKKEFRNIQQIQREKYYSAPNLLYLLDNKAKKRKLLEKSITTKSITDNNKRVDDNQLYFNNKFIYRYSRHQVHDNKKCHQHQIKTERRCSCKQRQQQEQQEQQKQQQQQKSSARSNNHNARIQKQQLKPLLVIIPSENINSGTFSITKNTQEIDQPPRSKLKAQNQRSHPNRYPKLVHI